MYKLYMCGIRRLSSLGKHVQNLSLMIPTNNIVHGKSINNKYYADADQFPAEEDLLLREGEELMISLPSSFILLRRSICSVSS